MRDLTKPVMNQMSHHRLSVNHVRDMRPQIDVDWYMARPQCAVRINKKRRTLWVVALLGNQDTLCSWMP